MRLLEILRQVLVESRIDALKKKFVDSGKIPEDIFNKVVEIDMTPNKGYLDWLFIQMVKDGLVKPENSTKLKVFLEDAYKMTEYLEMFHRLKSKYPQKDIFQYTIDSFKKASVNLKKTLNVTDLGAGLQTNDKYREFYIGNAAGYDIYEIPKGRTDLRGMSCDLGSGTEWCTATGKTAEYFDSYISSGPLFIIIRGKEKYQFHYESNSFMDANDQSII